MKNIPKTLKDPIFELNKIFKTNGYNVAKIVLVYDIDELITKEKELTKLIEKKQLLLI